ncbi:hypothetical protein J0H58_06850 [bacterium]|nr:hypothetical protein [bacterium]
MPVSSLRVEPLEDRLAPAGDLDPTFGTGGVTRFTSGKVLQLAPAPDGHILALVSGPNDPLARTTVVRFDANGTLDTSFGTGGAVAVPGGMFATALVAAPDGGAYVGWVASTAKYAVAHVTAGGMIDSAFGFGGTAAVPTGLPANSAGTADLTDLAVQPDGRIVAAGDARPTAGTTARPRSPTRPRRSPASWPAPRPWPRTDGSSSPRTRPPALAGTGRRCTRRRCSG